MTIARLDYLVEPHGTTEARARQLQTTTQRTTVGNRLDLESCFQGLDLIRAKRMRLSVDRMVGWMSGVV
jgi:hypothetical protein